MNIEKLKIQGFRNIPACEIKLHDITALLSSNSYGKSNALKAIAFGFDFINAPISTKDNMMGWKIGFPLNKNILNDEFSFEITLTSNIGKNSVDIVYGYSFSWRLKDNSNARILNEYLKIRKSTDKQIYSNYIKRTKDQALYKSSESGRCSKKIQIDDNELVINKLLAYDNLFYLSIVKKINSIDVYIDRNLDTREAFEPDPIIRKSSDNLILATSENIPRTLYQLKKSYPEKYEYLEDVYLQLFPKIEHLNIKKIKINNDDSFNGDLPEEYEIVDTIYVLFCKERNMSNAINFQQMSDGARRILLLLTNLLLAEINNTPLICVEEPENSINPGLLQQYIEVINDISNDTKILFTSHSPYLINYLEPESIYFGYPNNQDVVIFYPIRKSAVNKLYKDSEGLNMSYGDYIFDMLSSNSFLEEIKKYVKIK